MKPIAEALEEFCTEFVDDVFLSFTDEYQDEKRVYESAKASLIARMEGMEKENNRLLLGIETILSNRWHQQTMTVALSRLSRGRNADEMLDDLLTPPSKGE